jgi:hypothetical protein
MQLVLFITGGTHTPDYGQIDRNTDLYQYYIATFV